MEFLSFSSFKLRGLWRLEGWRVGAVGKGQNRKWTGDGEQKRDFPLGKWWEGKVSRLGPGSALIFTTMLLSTRAGRRATVLILWVLVPIALSLVGGTSQSLREEQERANILEGLLGMLSTLFHYVIEQKEFAHLALAEPNTKQGELQWRNIGFFKNW